MIHLSLSLFLKYIYIFLKNITDEDKIDILFNTKQSILFYYIIIILYKSDPVQQYRIFLHFLNL